MLFPVKRQVSAPTNVPAPVGGLNARDSLAAMAETDAILLQNWWPQPFGCSVRRGYIAWATGMPAAVETLATLSTRTGAQKFYAWAGTEVYDITLSGVVGAPVVTGLAGAMWQSVMMTNTAGSFLIAVNGLEEPIIFGEAAINRIAAGDGIAPFTWAGVSPTSIIQVTVHQRRLWGVQRETTFGWYLPPDQYQGTMERYDFGPVFGRGGYLQYLTTWTVDDNSGAQDRLVAMSSRGEAAIYEGTDPNNAATWGLVGVYYVGPPVAGSRGCTKVGGDLYILTTQGVVSLNKLLASLSNTESDARFITSKIQFIVSELAATLGDLDHWSLNYYTKYSMLLLNVPSVTLNGNIQLAANQLINSWTEFLGMDAACWGSLDAEMYFGDYQGSVHRAWYGPKDHVLLDGSAGRGIVSNVQQAFTYFGNRSTQKQVGMAQPIFSTGRPQNVSIAVLYDYEVRQVPTPNPSAGGTSLALWNEAFWNVDFWGGGSSIQRQWIQTLGLGSAASLRMTLQTDMEVLWITTGYTLVNGTGIL